MDTSQNPTRKSLGFSLELNILVPDYEVDGFLLMDDHFEGAPLFRDTFCMAAIPGEGKGPDIQWGLQSKTPNEMPNKADPVELPGKILEYRIPVSQKTKPGIDAELIIRASLWNG